jgi:hemoglobin
VSQAVSIYQAAGGEEAFSTLVSRFYAGVAEDPLLRPLYPADPAMFAAAAEHLRLFLIQYWGGPAWYGERRGHPRLRMRHAPFSIGRPERDAWMRHMRAAVDALEPAPEIRDALLEYFETAATAMMNRGGPPF